MNLYDLRNLYEGNLLELLRKNAERAMRRKKKVAKRKSAKRTWADKIAAIAAQLEGGKDA